MKKLIIMVLMAGLTGGAYAGEALKALAAQAPAAYAGPAVGAPARAALTPGQKDMMTYAGLAGLYNNGQPVQLSELVSPDYPGGYNIELLTADKYAKFTRGGAHIKITGHYDFVGPVVYFSADFALAGAEYKGSGYSDDTPLIMLKPVNSSGAMNIEIKKNGAQLILKATGLPEGTGYGILTE